MPELLFTQAKISARAAEAAIAIKPSAKAPAVNVLISLLHVVLENILDGRFVLSQPGFLHSFLTMPGEHDADTAVRDFWQKESEKGR